MNEITDHEMAEALNSKPQPKQIASPVTVDAKLAAMIAPDALDVASLKLRPFTAGTLAQLTMRGNKLLTGKVEDGDIAFQVLAFLYVHAGEVKEVRRSVMTDGTFTDCVWAFADTVTIKDFMGAADMIRSIIERGMAGLDYEVADNGTGESKN